MLNISRVSKEFYIHPHLTVHLSVVQLWIKSLNVLVGGKLSALH